MKKCGYSCPICMGVFCERMTEECSRCKKEFPAGDLWMVHGNYYCSDCYMEISYGEQITSERTAVRN